MAADLRWARGVDEPSLWFGRFDRFRLLGAGRSIDEVFRRANGLDRDSPRRPGQVWYEAAARWCWRERAEAWDESERVRLAMVERRRRGEAREARILLIGDVLERAAVVLDLARLEELSVVEARELLPTVRLLLRDMLSAQRLELGLPLLDSGGELLPFSADELVLARRELVRSGLWIVGALQIGESDDG